MPKDQTIRAAGHAIALVSWIVGMGIGAFLTNWSKFLDGLIIGRLFFHTNSEWNGGGAFVELLWIVSVLGFFCMLLYAHFLPSKFSARVYFGIAILTIFLWQSFIPNLMMMAASILLSLFAEEEPNAGTREDLRGPIQ